MSVSKRVRFEVLRRDNHACRYCGAAAPEAKLTVDHVIPVALGGTDTPDNLVCACSACNSGKTSTAPDAAVADDVKASAMEFKRNYTAALQAEVIKIQASREYRGWFSAHWEDCLGSTPLPRGWKASVDHWHSLDVPWEIVENALDIASSKTTLRTNDAVFKYMAGIVWNTIRNATETVVEQTTQPELIRCDRCGEYGEDRIQDQYTLNFCVPCFEKQVHMEGVMAGREEGSRSADVVAAFIDGTRNAARINVEWVA